MTLVRPNRTFVFCRFFNKYVEGGARDMTGIERCCQSSFIDQTATSAIDDANALLGLGECRRVDDVPGLVGQRV